MARIVPSGVGSGTGVNVGVGLRVLVAVRLGVGDAVWVEEGLGVREGNDVVAQVALRVAVACVGEAVKTAVGRSDARKMDA